MGSPSGFLALFLGVVASRVFELALAKRNAAILLARGAEEHGAAHHPLLVAFHACFLASFAAEAASTGFALQGSWRLRLACFLALQPARWWIIRSLGEAWNTRILVVRGAPLSRRGPYRYLKHPNYWLVAAEILLLPSVFSCWATAAWATCVNALLLLGLRIPAEERALRLTASDDRWH